MSGARVGHRFAAGTALLAAGYARPCVHLVLLPRARSAQMLVGQPRRLPVPSFDRTLLDVRSLSAGAPLVGPLKGAVR